MATMRITEYAGIGLNGAAQIAMEPAVGSQNVTFTTAAQSAAFAPQTNFVKLHPDANCHVVFGSDPTAVAASEFLLANMDHWRGVKPGHKVSVYDGSS